MIFVGAIIALVVLVIVIAIFTMLAGAGAVREGPDPSEGDKSTG